MDLISALAQPVARPQAEQKSRVDVWADTRPESEREAIRAAAINPDWGHVALRDLLVAEGMPEISENAFRTWRVKLGWRRES